MFSALLLSSIASTVVYVGMGFTLGEKVLTQIIVHKTYHHGDAWSDHSDILGL